MQDCSISPDELRL